MNIIKESYIRIYPDKEVFFSFFIEYNNRFKGYNANIKKQGKNITVSLSKNCEEIDKEIQIGIIQHLLIKLFKDKKETTNSKLYETFLKKIHIAIPKNRIDSILKKIFDEINKERGEAGVEAWPYRDPPRHSDL